MKVKKINEGAYEFRFGNTDKAVKIFAYLCKSYDMWCRTTDCDKCDLIKFCEDYEKLMNTLRDMTE